MGNIGKTIKRLREDKGWTRKDLAREAGLAHISIESYEGGRRIPNLEAYEKLSRALGLSPGGILDRVRN